MCITLCIIICTITTYDIVDIKCKCKTVAFFKLLYVDDIINRKSHIVLVKYKRINNIYNENYSTMLTKWY